MTSERYKSLRLFFIVFAVCVATLGFISYAQGQQATTTSEKVEAVQQEVQANNSQLDTTTIAAVGGTAAGIVAVVKGLLDQRLNSKRDRTTDVDAGRFIILISKLYQAKYLYPHMTDKEILDLPISNNPMSKMTLGQAITSEAELWANGNQQYWGTPSPQMSVPTMTTVDAVKTKDNYPTIVGVADNQKPVTKQTTPATQATPATTNTTTSTSTVGK